MRINLKEILGKELLKITAKCELVDIKKVEFDSRKISANDIFVAIEGYSTDGHKYINAAIKNGSKVIIYEKSIDITYDNICFVKVKNSRLALALLSNHITNYPSKKLDIIGITGTNGKTSVSHILRHIFNYANINSASLGTIGLFYNNKILKLNRTTPEITELNTIFNKLISENIYNVFMEVSSHALSLFRIYGVNYKYKIFLNLTEDHLDFHHTMENYKEAKFSFFFDLHYGEGYNIVNFDDKYGKELVSKLSKFGKNVFTFGTDNKSDVRLLNYEIFLNKIRFELRLNNRNEYFTIPIPSIFYMYNSIPAIIVALQENIKMDIIKQALENLPIIPGRFQFKMIDNSNLVIVDYAHTPDGIRHILNTANMLPHKKLYIVFGCGGDRDQYKRPLMGEIATELSDFVIITNDNPRNESPDKIIKDIVQGVKKDNYKIIYDRREAIKFALTMLTENDILVIAGKGHENYQYISNRKILFNDWDVVNELLERRLL